MSLNNINCHPLQAPTNPTATHLQQHHEPQHPSHLHLGCIGGGPSACSLHLNCRIEASRELERDLTSCPLPCPSCPASSALHPPPCILHLLFQLCGRVWARSAVPAPSHKQANDLSVCVLHIDHPQMPACPALPCPAQHSLPYQPLYTLPCTLFDQYLTPSPLLPLTCLTQSLRAGLCS